MTRADFITENRQNSTVLVYKFPDVFRITAASRHTIKGNTMIIGRRVINLDGWTVAVKP